MWTQVTDPRRQCVVRRLTWQTDWRLSWPDSTRQTRQHGLITCSHLVVLITHIVELCAGAERVTLTGFTHEEPGVDRLRLSTVLVYTDHTQQHLTFAGQTVNCIRIITVDWLIEHGFTSAPTQYKLYGRRFLQVWWPNQQCQSTEGGWLVIQTGLSLNKLTSLCYNTTTCMQILYKKII